MITRSPDGDVPGPVPEAGAVREVRLDRYPGAEGIAERDFAVFPVAAPAGPGPGEALVALRRLGLNAGLASRVGGPDTAYGPGVRLGDVPWSDAVVEVLASRDPALRPGDLALGKVPWRTRSVLPASALRKLPPDAAGLGLESFLTVLGHVGFTAWTGLTHIGRVREGETVFVSGAAGGVGSCAVQFARARGARVIGSAGSARKLALLTGELGAEAAFDHHEGPAAEALRAAAPQGIDLFFDNVGGEQLEAALEVLRFRGRAVLCGAASQYARGEVRGPANYVRMIYQELTMRGFTVTAHEELRPVFEEEVGALVRDGAVRGVHTTAEGFDAVPAAFAGMLAGHGLGRTIVSVD
ncbi:NADP-dependent oxidoreductase [Streptomyces sp. NPDC049954]|uniref:NADP-dependent oxidoreductase n=1 Tax=Streptomyces sp. NPDC049954 TaxID=3155779 RepID=UPI00342215D9